MVVYVEMRSLRERAPGINYLIIFNVRSRRQFRWKKIGYKKTDRLHKMSVDSTCAAEV